MSDLEDGPDHFVLFLSFVRSIFGVLELVGEFEQRVFDVFETIGWRLAVSGATDRRHFGLRVGVTVVKATMDCTVKTIVEWAIVRWQRV
jgi:hypothetical protein